MQALLGAAAGCLNSRQSSGQFRRNAPSQNPFFFSSLQPSFLSLSPTTVSSTARDPQPSRYPRILRANSGPRTPPERDGRLAQQGDWLGHAPVPRGGLCRARGREWRAPGGAGRPWR
eukprot:scaffold106_cov246-Pinguiococcus_pyrenoidosus.AAC.18